MIAGNPDHALDVVGLTGRRPEEAGDRVEQRTERVVVDPRHQVVVHRRTGVRRIPGARTVEDHDVAARNRPHVVNELVHQDFVADEQSVLHRTGWDKERLHHETLDQQSDRQRHGEEHDHLGGEGPPAACRPLLLVLVRGLAVRRL